MSSEVVATDISITDYGKNYVKFLYVKKDGVKHYIKVRFTCFQFKVYLLKCA